jgi:hypothetical protein
MALNRDWLEIADRLKLLAQPWEQAAVKLEEANLVSTERPMSVNSSKTTTAGGKRELVPRMFVPPGCGTIAVCLS